MQIIIPNNCERIISILEQNGFEAYIVGGCVRDSLLGFTPKDWDITTSASPPEVSKLFETSDGFSIIPTGEKYGTVTVYCRNDRETYEVTTYRFDGDYSDGRRPDKVVFSKSIEDDLLRRDFTINAIAYNKRRGIIDLYHGQQHLRDKTLCLVGDPYARLREDGLRIMRAVRFSYKLKFKIETKTYKALQDSIDNGYLAHVSYERIRDELWQILEHFYFERSTYGLFEKLLFNIIPELKDMQGFDQKNPFHVYDLWEHSMIAMINTPKLPVVRMVMLLHDIGKLKTFTLDENGIGHFYGHPAISAKIAGEILERLKLDNKTKEMIITLIIHHDDPFMDNKKSIKRMLNKIGRENFEMLTNIRLADIAAHNPRFIYDKCSKLNKENELLKTILTEDECFSLKDLSVNGKDLIELGLKGKEVGLWLNACLELVMDNNSMNDKKLLLEYISYEIISKE